MTTQARELRLVYSLTGNTVSQSRYDRRGSGVMRTQLLYLRDLPVTSGPAPPHPMLYCPRCGGESSASRGDYFWQPPTKPFRCGACRGPLVLVTKRIVIEAVRP